MRNYVKEFELRLRNNTDREDPDYLITTIEQFPEFRIRWKGRWENSTRKANIKLEEMYKENPQRFEDMKRRKGWKLAYYFRHVKRCTYSEHDDILDELQDMEDYEFEKIIN